MCTLHLHILNLTTHGVYIVYIYFSQCIFQLPALCVHVYSLQKLSCMSLCISSPTKYSTYLWSLGTSMFAYLYSAWMSSTSWTLFLQNYRPELNSSDFTQAWPVKLIVVLIFTLSPLRPRSPALPGIPYETQQILDMSKNPLIGYTNYILC